MIQFKNILHHMMKSKVMSFYFVLRHTNEYINISFQDTE